MKNRIFWKVLFLALAVVMLFALSACGKAEAVEYDITGKSDLTVEDTTFDGDVVIKGEGGSIAFVNCVFNGNVINNGGEGARVVFVDGNTFAEGSECVIDSSVTEATMESDLPKFLFFGDVTAASCKNAGAVVAFADHDIVFNGESYSAQNAELYNVDGTIEMVPYTGQEVTMHNVAKWTENGEEVNLHLAIFAE